MPPPAAADVEYRQAGPVQAELGGDGTLLGLRRSFKRFGPLGKISAGVLPIPIEEQAIQPSIQIIVVRDVPASTGSHIELIDRAPNPGSRTPKPIDQRTIGIGPEIGEEHGEHVVDRAAEWDQATIHISFPDRQLGVQYQPPDCYAGRTT